MFVFYKTNNLCDKHPFYFDLPYKIKLFHHFSFKFKLSNIFINSFFIEFEAHD